MFFTDQAEHMHGSGGAEHVNPFARVRSVPICASCYDRASGGSPQVAGAPRSESLLDGVRAHGLLPQADGQDVPQVSPLIALAIVGAIWIALAK